MKKTLIILCVLGITFYSFANAILTYEFNVNTVIKIDRVNEKSVYFMISGIEFEVDRKTYTDVKPGDYVLVIAKFETKNEISFSLFNFEFISILDKKQVKLFLNLEK